MPLLAWAQSEGSASSTYLRSTLRVNAQVAECVSALNRAVRTDPRFDRLIQLDRSILRAKVESQDAIFSMRNPVVVDQTVSIRGSARLRGTYDWHPVRARCGLQGKKVVATSIEPRSPRQPKPMT